MTSLFNDMLKMHGYIFCLVKKPITRNTEANCWIDPEGKWYSVGVCNHNYFAFQVFREKNPLRPDDCLPDDFRNATRWLIEQGWIYIEDTLAMGTILRGYQHMTKAQYKVLLKRFGEQRLFRGWTIRAMWLAKEDMKQEAKLD